MEFCLAYVRSRAELYRLNPAAWFVAEQCEGRDVEQIARRYRAVLGPSLSPKECRAQVRAALEALLAMGIVVEQSKQQPGNPA
jgi:hypothetical protein